MKIISVAGKVIGRRTGIRWMAVVGPSDVTSKLSDFCFRPNAVHSTIRICTSFVSYCQRRPQPPCVVSISTKLTRRVSVRLSSLSAVKDPAFLDPFYHHPPFIAAVWPADVALQVMHIGPSLRGTVPSTVFRTVRNTCGTCTGT